MPTHRAGVLQLARSDRGVHDRERVGLAEVVREAAGRCRPALRAAGLTLRLDLGSVLVPGDRMLLGQLVSNLLDNAIRYNVPDGTVWAELGPGRPLTIANTGRPVPPEQVPRLFQPFHSRVGRGPGGGMNSPMTSHATEGVPSTGSGWSRHEKFTCPAVHHALSGRPYSWQPAESTGA